MSEETITAEQAQQEIKGMYLVHCQHYKLDPKTHDALLDYVSALILKMYLSHEKLRDELRGGYQIYHVGKVPRSPRKKAKKKKKVVKKKRAKR